MSMYQSMVLPTSWRPSPRTQGRLAACRRVRSGPAHRVAGREVHETRNAAVARRPPSRSLAVSCIDSAPGESLAAAAEEHLHRGARHLVVAQCSSCRTRASRRLCSAEAELHAAVVEARLLVPAPAAALVVELRADDVTARLGECADVDAAPAPACRRTRAAGSRSPFAASFAVPVPSSSILPKVPHAASLPPSQPFCRSDDRLRVVLRDAVAGLVLHAEHAARERVGVAAALLEVLRRASPRPSRRHVLAP